MDPIEKNKMKNLSEKFKKRIIQNYISTYKGCNFLLFCYCVYDAFPEYHRGYEPD